MRTLFGLMVMFGGMSIASGNVRVEYIPVVALVLAARLLMDAYDRKRATANMRK